MYSYNYYYSNEIYHHGIKGMKWGVRRFQKKDGSLTSAGKKRYSEESKDAKNTDNKSSKQKRYDELYHKYKTLGYSNDDARQTALGQVKTERALKVIGGLTIAAVATYAAYRYYDNHADRTISPDKVMQTVHMGDVGDRLKPGNPFYATYTKRDNTIYSSRVFSHFKDSSNVTRFYTKDGVKVASEASSRKVFDELVKTNPEVKDYVDKISGIRGKKKGYQQFNYSLVLRNDSETTKRLGLEGLDHDRVHKIFYDKLKERGYGGLIDINDSKVEGFTWNPVIVFDDQIKHIVSSTKATPEQLGEKQLAKGTAYALARKTALKPIDLKDPNVVAGSIYLSAFGVTSSINNRNLNKKVKFVEDYKKEHPNTKLSNAQIASMYNKR